jgi:hypothetical protein
MYHWVEVNGKDIGYSMLPFNFSARDLEALETAGLIFKIDRWVNAEDDLESKTTYALSSA